MQIIGFTYQGPSKVRVGTTLTVTNQHAIPHTLTDVGGSFDTGVLAQGESSKITLNTPGTYEYFCTLHVGQMGGVITVEG